MGLLEAWSSIHSLSFEGESTFSESDEEKGENLVAPEPSVFKCWLTDLQLNKSRWESYPQDRRCDFFPFFEPIRYRAEYKPRVSRWIQGAAPFLIGHSTEVCDGGDVLTERLRGYHNGVEKKEYIWDDYRDGKNLDTWTLGVRFLPPLLSTSSYRILAEIDSRGIEPRTDPGDATSWYELSFPEYRQEIKVYWDARKNWFTRIEAARWGIPWDILDKLKLHGTISAEDKVRVETERELVDSETFEAGDFEEVPRGGLFFPGKVSYQRNWRKTCTKYAWKYSRWGVNEEMPDDLFRMPIPKGSRMHDRRSRNQRT